MELNTSENLQDKKNQLASQQTELPGIIFNGCSILDYLRFHNRKLNTFLKH